MNPARLEVLTAVLMLIQVFWHITPRRRVNIPMFRRQCSPKHHKLFTGRHDVTSYKVGICVNLPALTFFFCGATGHIGLRPHCWGLWITHTNTHTHTQTVRLLAEQVTSPSQRPLPEHHTTNTRDENKCPQRIRNRDLSNQAPADLLLRLHGHRVG
jgi:hypothetical protein